MLPFASNSVDIVYSWGVLHHSPDTRRAINEVWRVLKPGGLAKIMIYHKSSMIGYMLWIRYALIAGHPFRTLDEIYYNYLESPGTKAYSITKARRMFQKYSHVDTKVELSFGDLLQGEVGARHKGVVLSAAKALWPREFIKRACKGLGLMLLIEARK